MCSPRRTSTHGCARHFDRGLAESPDDRFAEADEWATTLLDALGTGHTADTGHRWRPLRALVAAALAIAVIVGTVLIARSGSSGDDGRPSLSTPSAVVDGPQIVGPETLLIGEPGTYLHEDRAGITYTWTDPTGAKSTEPAIVVTPVGPDDLVVTLTENDQGVERTSTLIIRVRTR